jgi:hypothetical protein
LYSPSTNPSQRDSRGGGQLFITIVMPLDPALGFAMVVFFFWMVDAFKHLILSIPILSIYERFFFFVLQYCAVKYANIFYSCCKESFHPEFGNLRQRQFFHVGINIILQTCRINTREIFLQHLVPHRMKTSLV